MKRSSKKENQIEESMETSSEDFVETTENTVEIFSETEEIPATSAETIEFSTADVTGTKEKSEEPEELAKTVEISTVKTASVNTVAGGMSAVTKGLITLAVIFAVGAGLLYWSVKNLAGQGILPLNGLNKAEFELLLKDANPMLLKRLADDPELKKKQLENIRQLFAMANAAKKAGLVDKKVKSELDSINIEVTATNYDREINKDKGSMPSFGFIGEDRVNEFWGEGQAEPTGFKAVLARIGLGDSAKYARRQRQFEEFFNNKVEMAKESGQIAKEFEASEDDLKQAKEYFAKTRIYYEEAKEKMPTMSEEFRMKTQIAVKLQQASYLSRLYATKVVPEKVKVTEEEIDKYIAEHPELDQSAKRTKAEELLNRAKAGEDFAKLADEFSEDPGNTDMATQKKKGGLYEGITKGQFMPEFEQAALALEPGQIAPNLVETTYGFHIIKLEKKGEKKGADGKMQESYDVRHILISTGYQDPENPMSGPMPVREYVKDKLETEKEKAVLDKIIADNPVEVAEDFEIPKPSDEEMQKMMEQQMQMMQQQQQMQSNSNTSANSTATPKKNQTNKK